jgi:hypothetical protein
MRRHTTRWAYNPHTHLRALSQRHPPNPDYTALGEDAEAHDKVGLQPAHPSESSQRHPPASRMPRQCGGQVAAGTGVGVGIIHGEMWCLPHTHRALSVTHSAVCRASAGGRQVAAGDGVGIIHGEAVTPPASLPEARCSELVRCCFVSSVRSSPPAYEPFYPFQTRPRVLPGGAGGQGGGGGLGGGDVRAHAHLRRVHGVAARQAPRSRTWLLLRLRRTGLHGRHGRAGEPVRAAGEVLPRKGFPYLPPTPYVLNVAVTLLPDTPRVREVELLARHVWGFYLPPTPYPLRAQRGRDPAAGHPARAGGGATGQARVGFLPTPYPLPPTCSTWP